MLLDNPFLTRELRQLERRPRGVQNSLLICLGLMALVLVGCVVFLSYIQSENRVVKSNDADLIHTGIWLLSILHIALCCIATGYGAYRFFHIESARSTLEPLKLLPYSPERWIWLKLSFPILCTLVAWTAGLPFFIFAALCTLISLQDVAFWMAKPLVACAAMLLLTLLYTPEMRKKQELAQAKENRGTRYWDQDYTIWNYLTLLIGGLSIVGIIFGHPGSTREFLWFASNVPQWVLWFIAYIAALSAAVSTAATALVLLEWRNALAWWLRVLALATLYSIPVGLTWNLMTNWFKIGAILVPLVILGRRSSQQEKKSYEEQNKAYIQRIAKLWDNPLLIKDMREAGRSVSIRYMFCQALATAVLGPPLLYKCLALTGDPTPFSSSIKYMTLACFMSIPMMWSGVGTRWDKEWTGQTMPQLLITPLTERELILGRMAAIPAFNWVGNSPFLPLVLALVGWGTWQGNWILAPTILALLPLTISAGIWCSTGIVKDRKPQQEPKRQEFKWEDVPFLVLFVAQVFTCYQSIHLYLATVNVNSEWVPTPLQAWLWNILLFFLNAGLCWAWLQLRIWQLRRFRSSDIDVPDSAIMNRSEE